MSYLFHKYNCLYQPTGKGAGVSQINPPYSGLILDVAKYFCKTGLHVMCSVN